jgi:hypothetical protein
MVLSVGMGAKVGENFIIREGGGKGGREAGRTVGREKEARAVDRATPFDLIDLLFDFQTGEWM